MRHLFLCSLFICASHLFGQGSFAPAADQPGTTAIHKDSSVFVGWATSCTVIRGPQNIAVQNSPLVNVGNDYMAEGKSGVNGTVTLGDGGEAILTFDYPVVNGNGWDFAIFENSFDGLFLELAFVEVSSDGVNYFRFPASSEIQDTLQTDGYGNSDPTRINNLAGKYKVQYGTPFDLAELTGIPGLNVDSITHIKVIDVVGTINELYASYDQFGNKINDPYPTDFPAGGFDLDAVGLINIDLNASIENVNNSFKIFPNPVSSELHYSSDEDGVNELRIYAIDGRLMYQEEVDQNTIINVEFLDKGIYLLSTPSGTQQFVKD